MSDQQTAFCRLCADLKSKTKLLNLQTDDKNKYNTFEKLSRLGLNVVDLNSAEDILPKTVCFVCIDLLDKSYNFVLDVASAQDKLVKYISDQKIKQEFSDDYENYTEKCDVKAENLELKVDELKIPENENDSDSPLSYMLSWKDFSWVCAYCDTVFPTVDELTVHSKEIHNSCTPYKCIDCNRRKLTLDRFLIHVKRHRKYLKLSCYKCHMKFQKQYDVFRHTKTHIALEYRCLGCNDSFSSQDALTIHTETYNQGRKQSLDDSLTDLSCKVCKKKFKNRGSLKTHSLTHTERKRDHTCDKCGKCFLNKHNLAGHMMLHEDVRPFQCEVCKHRFRTKSQLRTHIGVHNTTKPFSCQECGRQFRLLKQLTSHSIIHTDSLPYLCTFCHRSFRFRSILNEHIRQHTGLKPYSCQICVRDFTNWSNYNKHMKRRHGKEMAKKKYTPDGLFPINPDTGEAVIEPPSSKSLEWMQKILDGPRGPGRPRLKKKLD